MGKCFSQIVCMLKSQTHWLQIKVSVILITSTLSNFKRNLPTEVEVKFKDTQMKNNITTIFDHMVKKKFSLTCLMY